MKQEPFEVGGNRDVHRRRQRRLHHVLRKVPGVNETVQDVVVIGSYKNAMDGQPELLRVIASHSVAEVPRGHTERDCIAKRAAKLRHPLVVRVEVVHDLHSIMEKTPIIV